MKVRGQVDRADLTCRISEPVGQASRSKRARDASFILFFLLYNNVWLQCHLKLRDVFLLPFKHISIISFHPFALQLKRTTFRSKLCVNDTLGFFHEQTLLQTRENSQSTKSSFFSKGFSSSQVTDSLPNALLLKRWPIQCSAARIRLIPNTLE